MQRRGVVIILLVISVLGALATGKALWFNMAYLLAALLIIAYSLAWMNVNWVRLSRQTRARRAQVGRPLEERFLIRNTGWLPKLWLEVHDDSDVPGHHASMVVNNLRPGGEFGWTVRTHCRQRGRFTLGPITLISADPFGLFQMTRQLPATSHVVIYPAAIPLTGFALPVGILPGGDALHRRTHYITANAAGVREYEPGDSFNRIHWPSTARRGRLLVKEFELDPLADVWLFLDGYSRAHVALPHDTETEDGRPIWMRTAGKSEDEILPSTEEYAVTIAASLAQYFLRTDRAVGLAAYGHTREVTQADRGERQFNKLLETLAVIRTTGRVRFEEVLAIEGHGLARGTTLIAITPSVDPAWALALHQLSRRGLRVMAVIVDPQSFGGPLGTEAVSALLVGRGITTYIVRHGDSLAEVLVAHASSQFKF